MHSFTNTSTNIWEKKEEESKREREREEVFIREKSGHIAMVLSVSLFIQ
jgi:hypothetical protein